MENILNIISAIPLFNGLPDDQLSAIRQIAVEKQYNKGQTIFSEEDETKGLFVVVDGRVKIYKVSSEGKEQILHIIEAGQSFGEVTVFTGQQMPANAQTLAKSRLLLFPGSAFVGLVTANPSLALNLLAIMSKKLRQFAAQIENLSLKEIPARLASYLVYLAEEQDAGDAVTLNVSKGQLASLLGTIPETLSRIFAKLSAQNLIRVEGPKITLLDRQGIEDLAELGKDID
ncbi:MAG: Crp/Fnr family transcriptional regulator [Desulfobacterales bacterium]|jgi:CRP/FNR family transcriptional regulator|nr:Crp/Fnr family transcriptional regulator [Desulfobacterales bacterium]